MAKVLPFKYVAGEVEDVSQRRLQSKTFLLPDGQHRFVASIAPMHWEKQVGEWVEVDTAPFSVDGGKTWKTTETPYDLEWDAETLTLKYTSKRGNGSAQIRLKSIGGVPFSAAVTPAEHDTSKGEVIRSNAHADVEIELRLRPYGVEIFKTINTPTAPHEFEWEYIENLNHNLRIQEQSHGVDNKNRVERSKEKDDATPKASKRIELTHQRSGDDLTIPGKRRYTKTEAVTGRVRRINKSTGARTWVPNAAEYPLLIDASVSEQIAADLDDSVSYGAPGSEEVSPYADVFVDGGNAYPSWRWVLAIDASVTVSLAEIDWTMDTSYGDSVDLGFSAEDVANATAWTGYESNGPQATGWVGTGTELTFARADFPNSGTHTEEVTTIVQERVDKSGWASGNAMRMGFSDLTALSYGQLGFIDYGQTPSQAAQISITYSAGGGGSILPLLNQYYH